MPIATRFSTPASHSSAEFGGLSVRNHRVFPLARGGRRYGAPGPHGFASRASGRREPASGRTRMASIRMPTTSAKPS